MSKFKNIFNVSKKDDPAETMSVFTGPGRPRGKRSNPEFEQVTAYIRRDTHNQTKICLLQEGKGREFSELVEDLLSEWLRTR